MLLILLDGAVLRLSLIKSVMFTYTRLILKNFIIYITEEEYNKIHEEIFGT